MDVEKLLQELLKRLQAAYGGDLVSVVLHGSAVSGDYHQKFSDLNVVCVFRQLGVSELRKGRQAAEWWLKQKQPPPMLLSLEEMNRMHESFPIEFLDIQHNHRLLFGTDLFSGLQVSTRNYRQQVEHELRSGLLRLRRRYLIVQGNDKDVVRLMAGSLGAFATLARHALLLADAEDREVAEKRVRKREIFEAASQRFRLQAAPFETVMRLREGAAKVSGEPVHALFASYLEQITKLAEAVEAL